MSLFFLHRSTIIMSNSTNITIARNIVRPAEPRDLFEPVEYVFLTFSALGFVLNVFSVIIWGKKHKETTLEMYFLALSVYDVVSNFGFFTMKISSAFVEFSSIHEMFVKIILIKII